MVKKLKWLPYLNKLCIHQHCLLYIICYWSKIENWDYACPIHISENCSFHWPVAWQNCDFHGCCPSWNKRKIKISLTKISAIFFVNNLFVFCLFLWRSGRRIKKCEGGCKNIHWRVWDCQKSLVSGWVKQINCL